LLPKKFADHPTNYAVSFALKHILYAVHDERWKHKHNSLALRWIVFILPILQEELSTREIIVQKS
jgi:hypothetical protein